MTDSGQSLTLLRYVLGELSEAEVRAVETQLERDPEARARVLAMRLALEERVESLPGMTPSPQVWQGIATRIARERTPLTQDLAPRTPERVRRFQLLPVLLAVGIGVLSLGIWQGMRLNSEAARRVVAQAGTLQEDHLRLERYQNTAGVQRKILTNAQGQPFGTVLLSPNNTALYVLDVLPPEGKTYQAWGRKGKKVVSLGWGDGRTVEVSGLRGNYEFIGVSLEPRGGSPQPTHGLGGVPLL